MVISGVMHRVPERIKCAIYLDAYLPVDGQSLGDIRGQAWLNSLWSRAATEGGGYLINPPSSTYFGVTDPAEVAWADSLLTPHPVKTFADKVSMKNPLALTLPRFYIHCTGPTGGVDEEDKARSMGIPVIPLNSGHDAMIATPQALANLLVNLPRSLPSSREGSFSPGQPVSASLDSYPNPFGGGGTTVTFRLPKKPEGPMAMIRILDLNGRVVKTWQESAADQTIAILWDGTDQGGLPTAKGTYICTLQSGIISLSKMVTKY
jgi:hypothetical protein